jgi:hypothetical protein
VLLARPRSEGRLKFRMDRDAEARRTALLEAGLAAPSVAEPAWFSPEDRGLYAFRGESDVFARMMVVYGAVLQFHGTCKPKNLDLDVAWYVQGLAQAMCVHAWDGKRAEFAVKPRLCVIDYPSRAIEALGGKRFGEDLWNEERMKDPYVNWAAVRFALFDGDAKYRAKFQRLALGHTGSKMSGREFLRSLGREKDVTEEFRTWLVGAQHPLAVVHGDWEDRPDGRIEGGPSKEGELAAVVLREPRAHLAARLNAHKDERLVKAVLLGWEDERNYVLGHVAPPYFVVEFVRDRKQVDQARYALPDPAADSVLVEVDRLETKAGAIRKQVAERPGSVRVVVDGKELGKIAVYDGPLGFAVTGGRAVFSEVAFR